jgi:hypothetical protein
MRFGARLFPRRQLRKRFRLSSQHQPANQFFVPDPERDPYGPVHRYRRSSVLESWSLRRKRQVCMAVREVARHAGQIKRSARTATARATGFPQGPDSLPLAGADRTRP